MYMLTTTTVVLRYVYMYMYSIINIPFLLSLEVVAL